MCRHLRLGVLRVRGNVEPASSDLPLDEGPTRVQGCPTGPAALLELGVCSPCSEGGTFRSDREGIEQVLGSQDCVLASFYVGTTRVWVACT
jgi:hypothetical protein